MKLSNLIQQIQSLAEELIDVNYEDQFISVGMYDCSGSWQVWIVCDKSGMNPKDTKEIYLDSNYYYEDRTLLGALKKLKQALEGCEKISISENLKLKNYRRP